MFSTLIEESDQDMAGRNEPRTSKSANAEPNSQLAVIFDCDGILVDSEVIGAKVLRIMAAELQVFFSPKQALSILKGRKVATWVAELEDTIGRKLPADFVADFRGRSACFFKTELKSIPDIEPVIRNLQLPFCTASSAPRDKIELTLGLTGLRQYFGNRIFSAYDVGSWKPDPGLFLHAADAMGVAPENCLVVEDSVVGVQAAIAAGMTVLGYEPDNTSHSLTLAGAKVFNSMKELPHLLDRWRSSITVNMADICN